MPTPQSAYGAFGNLGTLQNLSNAPTASPTGVALPQWLASQWNNQPITGESGGVTNNWNWGNQAGGTLMDSQGKPFVQVGGPAGEGLGGGDRVLNRSLIRYDPSLGYITDPSNLASATTTPWAQGPGPMMLAAVIGGGLAFGGGLSQFGAAAGESGASVGAGAAPAADTGSTALETQLSNIGNPYDMSLYGGTGADSGGSLLSNLNRLRQVASLGRNLLGGGPQGGRTGGGMPTGSGGFDFGSLLSLIGQGRSAGLWGGGVGTPSGATNVADRAAGMADPWGQSGQRAQFADLLTPDRVMSMLGQGPGGFSDMIKNDPGYQFDLSQGIGAINMGDAAQGTLRSGNRLTELQQYGTGLASKYGQDFFNRNLASLGALGHLGGVDSSSPTAAAASVMSGFEGATSLQNSGLNPILASLMGGSAGGGFGGILSSLGSPIINAINQGASGIWDWVSNLFGGGADSSGGVGGDIMSSVVSDGGDALGWGLSL